MKTEKNKKPSNPIAFPRTAFDKKGDITTFDSEYEGMTLRDYFAAKAMIYFIEANNGNFSDNDAGQIYYIADTMLKQREL